MPMSKRIHIYINATVDEESLSALRSSRDSLSALIDSIENEKQTEDSSVEGATSSDSGENSESGMERYAQRLEQRARYSGPGRATCADGF